LKLGQPFASYPTLVLLIYHDIFRPLITFPVSAPMNFWTALKRRGEERLVCSTGKAALRVTNQ
jgi:hypothetical protein